MNARALWFLVALRLVCGCAHARENPMGGLALLDSLSGTGVILVGIARGGSEKELADVLAVTWKPKLGAFAVPTCSLDAYAKIEQIVVRIDRFAATPIGVFGARGRGLRAAVEGCLKTAVRSASVSDEGRVTRYQVGPKSLHLVWLDESTVIGGPVDDAVATSALADRMGSAPNRSKLRPLLALIDARSKAWFAVDFSAYGEGWPANAPRPSVAWGQVVEGTLKATASFASADDARRAAELLRDGVRASGAIDASQVVFGFDGTDLLVTVPIAAAWAPNISRLLGAAVPPQQVLSVAAVGPIGALLGHVLDDTDGKPHPSP